MTSHTIQTGQVYRSASSGPPIRITNYAPGAAKAEVVNHATDEPLEAVPVRQLHDSPLTDTGRRRRAGFILDTYATRVAVEARALMPPAPTVVLRTAAERLRALAVAASTNTANRPTASWAVRYHRDAVTREELRDHDCYLEAVDNTTPDGRGREPLLRGGSNRLHGRGVWPHMNPQHAEYIAAMDPMVGLALADLLDDLATDRDGTVHPTAAALAVARYLLGGDR
ncbi:hypothetical protein [Streptomyces luteireticuli]|uniref:hypothetical protein n=1 Tax=Streptomyces luteireticuli TaxID=173858 RepID=UPI003557CD37